MIKPNTTPSSMRLGLFLVAASVLPLLALAAPAVDKQEAQPDNKAAEHLQLETSTITGHHELPRVLYIVPWKRAETGELPGRPPGSLLDEGLQPLDRGEFRREMRYSDQLAAAAPAAATDTHQSTQSKSTGE